MNAKLMEKLNYLVKDGKLTEKELKDLTLKDKDPWEEVKGILKKRKISAIKYQRKIRSEWD